MQVFVKKERWRKSRHKLHSNVLMFTFRAMQKLKCTMLKNYLADHSCYRFELFEQFAKLRHAVITRKNNLDFKKNIYYDLCSDILNTKLRSIIKAPGVHGNNILEVSSQHPITGQADGLSTRETHLALLNTHADCQIALFYDPVNHALANVHSGWRGSVQNIYRNAVQFMQKRYGSRPENLFACISPSLGPENSEFIHYRNELPLPFWKHEVKPFHFDFWAITEEQLLGCGLLREHIQIAEICTYAHSEEFYSYRRDKTPCRNATVAVLL